MLNQSTCFFVDMEKAYDHVPQQFVVGGISVLTSCSLVLSGKSDSFVHILGIKSKLFTLGVMLLQGCVLSPFLFAHFMDKISGHS